MGVAEVEGWKVWVREEASEKQWFVYDVRVPEETSDQAGEMADVRGAGGL